MVLLIFNNDLILFELHKISTIIFEELMQKLIMWFNSTLLYKTVWSGALTWKMSSWNLAESIHKTRLVMNACCHFKTD